MSSKNNKISVFSSISSSYYDHNYYSLYLKLKDFTDTSLPSKLLDEVQTIKKAVTDIQSSIESNYDGSTVQLTIENLEAMIRNLSRNYIAYGLTTPEAIGPKYAMSATWAEKINNYIYKIRNA